MKTCPTHTGDEASVPANEGHGRLAEQGARRRLPPRIACREAGAPPIDERGLIDRIEQSCARAGCAVPRWLIVNYYVALKTNPLLILAGAEGIGKVDFTRLFAGALIGAPAEQYASVPGRALWHTATGEGSYFRSIQERFASLRFIELLQEASEPTNAGKLYIVSFQRLHPGEVEPYLASLVQFGAAGEWRLSIPGAPIERQPTIPRNMRITATVDTADGPALLSRAALRHAGVIDFATSLARRAEPQPEAPPAPPGLERLWLRAALSDIGAARRRLGEVLGAETIERFFPSSPVRQAIWDHGIPLFGQMLRELTVAVANSFDAAGVGLFDPYSPRRNAQIAYDTQIIQRVRGQVADGTCPSIAEYFAWVAPTLQAA